MPIPTADHHCDGIVLRVLTGRVVYRLSSIRNDWDSGLCVHVRQVLPADELGPRELVSLRRLSHLTERTEPIPCDVPSTTQLSA